MSTFSDESVARMLENMATKLAKRDETIDDLQNAMTSAGDEIERLRAAIREHRDGCLPHGDSILWETPTDE